MSNLIKKSWMVSTTYVFSHKNNFHQQGFLAKLTWNVIQVGLNDPGHSSNVSLFRLCISAWNLLILLGTAVVLLLLIFILSKKHEFEFLVETTVNNEIHNTVENQK